MSEPIFNSDLTMEQIEKNFEGMDFFAGLMEGLQEAYACEKGNAAPGTISHKRSLPRSASWRAVWAPCLLPQARRLIFMR